MTSAPGALDAPIRDASARQDARLGQIEQWLAADLHFDCVRIEPASSDASFRRYFRAWRRDGATRIVMDAPPDKEDLAPFLKVAQLLEGCGVHVPQVEAAERGRGFLLLEDLGSEQYLSRLIAGDDPQPLYAEALAALLRIQVEGLGAARELAPYDAAALGREMALMPEWFCARHLRLDLSGEEQALLAETFHWLAAEALAQPVVFVHRDYHSRNLLVTGERSPGIVDFQDALAGPVTYDLVSLLKDCYIDWPRARVVGWVEAHRRQLAAANIARGAGPAEFLRWFDLMGLQRHVKVLGIFARLYWRDGKGGYLADLPRTLQYVLEAARLYPRLRAFDAWLQRRVLPRFAAANAAALAAGRPGSLA
jgi:aminoglycoside/choline kinase family phosphotransferase